MVWVMVWILDSVREARMSREGEGVEMARARAAPMLFGETPVMRT